MIRVQESFKEAGSPRVFIPHQIIKRYGDPIVNNQALGELFEALRLPAEKTTLKLYDGSGLGEIPPPFDIWRNGWRTPYSNSYHVPVWNIWSGSITPMSKVIALGLQASEKRQQSFGRRFLASEISVASGVSIAASEVTHLGGLLLAGAGGLMIAGIGKAQVTNPGQLQFGQTPEVLELRKSHDSDIVFAKQTFLKYLDQPHSQPLPQSD